jgi:proteic killer suppression protein
MIKSFRHKGLEDFFYNGTKRGIRPKHADKLAGVLDALDAATSPGNMGFPGSGLHPLHASNIWAVKVSGNWRITFRFEGEDAFDVDYVNYH